MMDEKLIDSRTVGDIRSQVGPGRIELEPARVTVYPCGCELRCVQLRPIKRKWAMCQYHEGFDAGLERASQQPIAPSDTPPSASGMPTIRECTPGSIYGP